MIFLLITSYSPQVDRFIDFLQIHFCNIAFWTFERCPKWLFPFYFLQKSDEPINTDTILFFEKHFLNQLSSKIRKSRLVSFFHQTFQKKKLKTDIWDTVPHTPNCKNTYFITKHYFSYALKLLKFF